MGEGAVIIFAAAGVILLACALIAFAYSRRGAGASDSAGKAGEYYAAGVIAGVLRRSDRHFTNVRLSVERRRTEIDNIVINPHGVFIIEVKNYAGTLEGAAGEFEWVETKEARGIAEIKPVKNPIMQAKRQAEILESYFRLCGETAAVGYYAILLRGNSPVKSKRILKSVPEVDSALHPPGTRLSAAKVNRLCECIEKLL